MGLLPPEEAHYGMSACQKILIQHAIGLEEPYVETGDVLRIAPDWLLASEVAWFGMNKSYERMGRPGFRRKDRFWLAGDHVVDPRVNDRPYEKSLIEASDRIAQEMDLGDNYAGHNTTIMHTEYYRSRCQPGMLVIGADSHTSSAGALGALAIGVGSTDLVVQLVTGETYLEVPEVLNINFTGRPPLGMSGKDVILGVMRELKRNTVAFERLVEYTGSGLQYLSCDARFAIANMTTEFGGIGACVVPDEVTIQYIEKRRDPKHKSDSLYFKPDENARYAQLFVIDLSKLEHCVALYPSPDNVVPIVEAKHSLQNLQGVFIGACTTTEEELILAALVLRESLKEGMQPTTSGLRRMTAGSNSILSRLQELDLLRYYEDAGFVIGAPGCSYCVGMGVDKAAPGEVWLSSQNRNYRDRMGPGSIANIASAATVAISSFSMSLTDPQRILSNLDLDEFDSMRAYWKDEPASSPTYSSPNPRLNEPLSKSTRSATTRTSQPSSAQEVSLLPTTITGLIQRFGPNIDTDTIAPTAICHSHLTPAQVAQGAFLSLKPTFSTLSLSHNHTIIVAEEGFGCGSSREQAPKALMFAGIKCVIAKSFAFIYARNSVNVGLLNIRIGDKAFYDVAKEGCIVEVDVEARVVRCAGVEWGWRLDPIQEGILRRGGLLRSWEGEGARVFEVLQALSREGRRGGRQAKGKSESEVVAKKSVILVRGEEKEGQIDW